MLWLIKTPTYGRKIKNSFDLHHVLGLVCLHVKYEENYFYFKMGSLAPNCNSYSNKVIAVFCWGWGWVWSVCVFVCFLLNWFYEKKITFSRILVQINEYATSAPTAFYNSSAPESSLKNTCDLAANFANTIRQKCSICFCLSVKPQHNAEYVFEIKQCLCYN